MTKNDLTPRKEEQQSVGSKSQDTALLKERQDTLDQNSTTPRQEGNNTQETNKVKKNKGR